MTLEQLRIFEAVAEREHVTRAAEALNLTQSAVSAAIAALEERHAVLTSLPAYFKKSTGPWEDWKNLRLQLKPRSTSDRGCRRNGAIGPREGIKSDIAIS